MSKFTELLINTLLSVSIIAVTILGWKLFKIFNAVDRDIIDITTNITTTTSNLSDITTSAKNNGAFGVL